jgi:probable F420-dependent oxidoreductase
MATANGARALADAYPGRFVLGIGVSHAPAVAVRGASYGKPVTAMRAYLDAMAEAQYRPPPPPEDAPVLLAALGPRMLELARDRTRGAHPYFVPVEHTVRAREILGAGSLLAPEQAVVLETDPARAREVAREHVRVYLALDNYRRSLLRLGFGEDDVAGDGSDRLVDAVVAWGDVEAVASRVRAHLEAGADHVCVQVLGAPPGELPLPALRELAPALVAL